MRYLAALMLAGCMLFGCQSRQTAPVPDPIDLSWLAYVENWRGPGERMTQLAIFEDNRNGQTHTIRFDVELTRSALVMVAQTTMGVPLYESVFDDGVLEVRRHMDEPFPVEPVIADFLLANWPAEELMPGLSRIGYTLTQHLNSRLLKDELGSLQIEMRLAAGDGQTLQITHHDIPLTIRIRTLERRPLE